MDENQGASAEMPKYKCYKEVWALKIKEINGISLVFEESGYAPIQVDQEWFNKHNPEAGGYYVVYKDGYKSYSPAKAFEEGYELIKA